MFSAWVYLAAVAPAAVVPVPTADQNMTAAIEATCLDYFHMGKFGERWVIVNALWYPKPKDKD
jgi:hypothetical protein